MASLPNNTNRKQTVEKVLDAIILLFAMCVLTVFFGYLGALSVQSGKSLIILSLGYVSVMTCFSIGLYQTFTE